MNTYLGVSSLLSTSDLDLGVIADGAVLYMEGYLFDRDDAKAAFRMAARTAHEHGRQVSLTLSDSFCVDRYRDEFLDLMRKRRIEDTIPREVVADGCLLCSEDKPHHCHRRVVAEYFKQHWGDVEIAHLG